MSRATSLSPNWAAFAEAVGGINKLAEMLGISYATLFRVARGLIPVEDSLRTRIVKLAEEKKIPPPIKPPSSKPKSIKMDKEDFEILEYLGASVASRRRIPQELITHLVQRLGTANLIQLAESDDVSTNVQLAVTKLLGL